MTKFDTSKFLVQEDAIEPGLPIIDPHHHLYSRPDWRYLFDDLLSDISGGHNVLATVYVETLENARADGPESYRPVGETEFANGVAAISASGNFGPARLCAGIVGHADLCLGEAVDEILAAHIAAGGGRFRGIRYVTYWDPDENIRNLLRRRPAKQLMADPRFRAGFNCLRRHDLSFDAIFFHPQIPELQDLARTFDDTPIVLNHLGFPLGVGQYTGKREEVFAAWSRDIRALAACPNVFIKLGGFGMALMGFEFSKQPGRATSEELARAWAPYFDVCIEAFGPARCMFEGNYPPDRATCTYNVLWNAFKHIARKYSPSEKADLFHGTASRFYRIAI